jgi:hypothetical protein
VGSVRIHNLDIVINKLRSVGGGAPQYMREVLDRAMREDLWPAWIEHISLDDHSLEELAKLGHPYSRRYEVDSFIHPDSEVHAQTGSFREASSIRNTEGPKGPVVQLVNTSPHYVFLRYGTRTMRMRDPGGAAMLQALPKIQKRFADEVKQAVIDYYYTLKGL